MKVRTATVLVAASLLAGCAGRGEAPESPARSLPAASSVAPSATSEPTPTGPSLSQSSAPRNQSFEDEAAAIISERTGSGCLVLGTGDFGMIDVTQYTDAIAALPHRTGWLDEKFIWVGSVDKLVDARHAALVGEAEHGTWIVFMDDAGQPRAESYWGVRNQAGDVIWFAKDSIAVTPCPAGP